MRRTTSRLVPILTAVLGPMSAAPAVCAPDGGSGHPLTFGGDLRVRAYALANVWDLDHGDDRDRWSAMRYRTRVSVRADLEGDVAGYVRLANQHWGTGVVEAAGADGDRWEADNTSGKVFVDGAWIEWRRVFGLPVEARIGRQDVTYGSGFVLFDGQSQLASTAIHLDGIRVRTRPGRALTLDLLAFKDEERRRDDAARDDLSVGGAYLVRTDPRLDGTEELYLLARRDQALDRTIGLLGARVRHRLGSGVDWDLEGGLQRGDVAGGRDQAAWGVKTELGWSLPSRRGAPRPFVGFVALSGDDPATAGTDERWDVFHGGWPQFGDLLSWTFLNLGDANGVAGSDPGYASGSSVPGEVVYSNLTIATLGLEWTPAAAWSLRLSGARLARPEPTGGADDLGRLAQLRIGHRPTADLSLALYAAWLDPGEAFPDDADPAHEVFGETALAF